MTCSYCHGQRHQAESCWINPSSKAYSPSWTPFKIISNSSMNKITATPQACVIAALEGPTIDGPTPRITGTMQDSTEIPILRDRGSCVNITNTSCMDMWGLDYQTVELDLYPIFAVSGTSSP